MLSLYILSLMFQAVRADSLSVFELQSVTVSASLKHNDIYIEQPLAFTSISMKDIESARLAEPKNLSLLVPNLLYADYGSKITSSIYIRGIGSRIDQPAMGLYIDDIPVLNKNNYDFDYFDISSIDVLKGPQGTLYGRNTIGGLIDIHTLSPFDYQGTRLKLDYGNAFTSSFKAATYQKPTDKLAFSIALNHHYSNGFFTNTYDDTPADKILSESGRIKLQAKLSEYLDMENILSINYVKQNGFAYAFYDENNHATSSINHNDPCNYKRFGLSEGLIFKYKRGDYLFSSTTSYQYMDDDMILDQDFRPSSMFTLRQTQRENALTQELIARLANDNKWQWVSGLFAFYKTMDVNAPVTFKKDGIDELILANANSGIHTVFPDADILIQEELFPIESSFKLPVFGLSLYHQSSFSVGAWKFIAGIRADYEQTAIRYENLASIHYRFTLTMPEYKLLPVEVSGKQEKSFFEIMPKAATVYNFEKGSIYAAITRGYKAGGFNVQMFSDIIQNKMMNTMMSDLGIYFEGNNPAYNIESVISYKPEYSWNYETGAHLRFLDDRLSVDAALFYIDCRNQQITVFPPGKTTGRMMSNAGQTRSFGTELSISYRYENFHISGAYGHTNAKFVTYENGDKDYSGHYVPYAPKNTFSINCGYTWNIHKTWLDALSVDAYWQGAGKIYWNEENTLSQPFYGLLNATLSFRKGNHSFGVWAKNITDKDYNTFYFKSIGHSFVQVGKPFQMGFFININI